MWLAIDIPTKEPEMTPSHHRPVRPYPVLLGTLLALAGGSATAGTCTATADLQRQACNAERRDDLLAARAGCLNLTDPAAQAACAADALATSREARGDCEALQSWRTAACTVLGEAPYDPPWNATDFDPDFHQPAVRNPYMPIQVGLFWAYAGGDETTTVEVLERTKEVEGVRCAVVRDLVYVDGRLHEATDDWLAHGRDGSVWYCGEEVKDYEVFEGDKPMKPELVSIDGSFKHGRDGAKAGMLMPAVPAAVGAWREEFSLGNAEDMAELVTTDYRYGRHASLDAGVPRALAERLCQQGCMITRNVPLTEPGTVDYKFYARGIGFFLEVSGDGQTKLQLVDCNVDDRCRGLPRP